MIDAELLHKETFVDNDGTVTGIGKEYIRGEGNCPYIIDEDVNSPGRGNV